jgi:hypothetical protein
MPLVFHESLSQDHVAAGKLYRAAADAGDVVALNNLALLYRDGKGVRQDYEEAARLFRAAADSGCAMSMYHLAHMHECGLGVATDRVEAADWLHRFDQACTASEAYLWGCRFFEGRDGYLPDLARALRLLTLAASRGHTGAMLALQQARGLGGLSGTGTPHALHDALEAARLEERALARSSLQVLRAKHAADLRAAMASWMQALDAVKHTYEETAAVVTSAVPDNGEQASLHGDSQPIDELSQHAAAADRRVSELEARCAQSAQRTEAMQAAHALVLEELRMQCAAQCAHIQQQLEAKHAEQVEALRMVHREEFQAMRFQHAAELERPDLRLSQGSGDLRDGSPSLQRLISGASERAEALRADYTAELAAMQQHASAFSQLQQELESSKTTIQSIELARAALASELQAARVQAAAGAELQHQMEACNQQMTEVSELHERAKRELEACRAASAAGRLELEAANAQKLEAMRHEVEAAYAAKLQVSQRELEASHMGALEAMRATHSTVLQGGILSFPLHRHTSMEIFSIDL